MMGKIDFNMRGFIICLFCPKSGNKVYFYTDVIAWKDAYEKGLEMMRLNAYKDFGILSITRTLNHDNNGKNM